MIRTLLNKGIFLAGLLILLISFGNILYGVVLDNGVDCGEQVAAYEIATADEIAATGVERAAQYVPGEVLVNFKEGVDPQSVLQGIILEAKNISRVHSIKPAVSKFKRDYKFEKGSNGWYCFRGKKYKEIEQISNEEIFQLAYKQMSPEEKSLYRSYKVILPEGMSVEQAVVELEKNPDVEYAQPNHIMELHMVPDDPYYSSSGSWGQNYDDLWGLKPDRLNCEQAWDIQLQGEGVIVAVLDTGVDYYHEDFLKDENGNGIPDPGEQYNIWINEDEIPFNGIDDDGNGYVDDVRGYDFSNRDNNPSDYYGHGTHCAGTIAAVGNNGKDIIGVAPKAKVMAVKIFPNAYDSVIVQAIRYAADNGAKVLSNSWGPRYRMPSNPMVESAIDYAHSLDCVVVFSAGNKNDDVGYYSPANYLRTMAVAATDHNDAKASFSCWGHNLDVTAPGVEVLSLRAAGTDMYLGSQGYTPGERFVPPYDYNAKCYRANGTSMSCPHVAGLAALVRSQNPGLSNEEVRQVIRVSADDILEGGWDKYSGHGRIDAFQALQAGPVCVAVISEPRQNDIVRGGVDIEGQAYGEFFANYRLEYGEGRDPNTWATIATSSSEVIDGKLASWNTTSVADGEYTLKLTVEDINARTYEFRCSVILETVAIASPKPGDSFAGRQTIEITGTAMGASMQYYTIEYGEGGSPTEWSTDGITLVNDGMSEVINGPLGCWDTSQITPAPDTSTYILKLTANYSGGIEKIDKVSISIDFSVMEGWPVKTRGSYFFSAAAVDLDGDGDKEIFKGEFDFYGGRRAKVYAFNHDGTPVDGWPFPGEPGYHSFKTPAIGDIDNDGELEIVIAGERGIGGEREKGWWVLEEDGSVAPGWPIKISSLWREGLNYGNLSLADLDNDGDLEIITGYGIDTTAAFHHDGTMMGGWPVTAEAYYSATPAIGDIDGDGDLEVVLWADPTDESDPVANRGKVYAWHHDGQPVTGWPQLMLNSNNAWDSPVALADFDNDGAMEIVAKDLRGTVYIWRGDGMPLPGWPRHTATTGFFLNTTPLAIGDIDGDGYLEIVAVNGTSVYVLQHTGEDLPGWPIMLGNTIQTSAAIGDIDGDGVQEVVIGCNTCKIYAFKPNGQMVPKFPKALTDAVLSVPVIDDIDLDGKTEIIATSHDGNIYVWSVDGGYQENSIPWPMFQYDLKRTGCYVSAEVPNQPPILDPIGNKIVGEGELLTFTVSAQDPDRDQLTFPEPDLPPGATFVNNGDNTATFAWTPAYNQAGEYEVTFTVSDGDLEDSETITITVKEQQVIAIELNETSWVLEEVSLGDGIYNTDDGTRWGNPRHVLKNTGEVDVDVVMTYTNWTGIPPGYNNLVDHFETSVALESGHLITIQPPDSPYPDAVIRRGFAAGSESSLCIHYQAPVELTKPVSEMSAVYEIRAYKKAD